MEHHMQEKTKLSNSIKSHDLFFMTIINMIPRELYKPPDLDKVNLNSKYYKHRRLPMELSDKKLISKQKREDKYNTNSNDMLNDVESESDDDDKANDDNLTLKVNNDQIEGKEWIINARYHAIKFHNFLN